jgi:hypothetical protein
MMRGFERQCSTKHTEPRANQNLVLSFRGRQGLLNKNCPTKTETPPCFVAQASSAKNGFGYRIRQASEEDYDTSMHVSCHACTLCVPAYQHLLLYNRLHRYIVKYPTSERQYL